MNKKNEELVTIEGPEMTEGLARIDDLEITPLSDEELDSVAGGYTDSNTTAASCACCAAGATNQVDVAV